MNKSSNGNTHIVSKTGIENKLCLPAACTIVFLCLFSSTKGMTQDFGENSDLLDSELSLSLSTTVNFNGALGGSIIIGQYGLFNTTNIIQAGSNTNTIEVIQQGTNNLAEVTQLGVDNSVFLLQQGENNLFTIVQDGNGNIANVNQFGEQTFIVTQIGNEMVVNTHNMQISAININYQRRKL